MGAYDHPRGGACFYSLAPMPRLGCLHFGRGGIDVNKGLSHVAQYDTLGRIPMYIYLPRGGAKNGPTHMATYGRATPRRDHHRGGVVSGIQDIAALLLCMFLQQDWKLWH